MMFVWKVKLKEIEKNPLDTDWEHLIILADDFGQAVQKATDYIKKTWLKIPVEITSCERLFEVTIK